MNLRERLAAAKDKLPLHTDERKAVWEAMELIEAYEKALKEIQDAHKFNVAALPPTGVHSICFIALGDKS